MHADWSNRNVDLEGNFYILRHAAYPAILTNNFITNAQKNQFFESSADLEAITYLHGRKHQGY